MPQEEQVVGPAVRLYTAGYKGLVSVIPPTGVISRKSKIRQSQRGKVPGKLGPLGWVGYNWRRNNISPESIDRWKANVGLRGECFAALDIDSENEQLTSLAIREAVSRWGISPHRTSRHPRALLVFRVREPFARAALTVHGWGEPATIEWLSKGRQYVVHGRHPSGAAYGWKNKPLDEWDPTEIPVVDEEAALGFLQHVAAKLRQLGLEVELGDHGRDRSRNAPPQESLKAPTIPELEAVVAKIVNDAPTYSEWIRYGYAIKAAAQDDPESGFELWQDFSGRWVNGENAAEDVEVCWDSLKPPFRIGWEWLRTRAGFPLAEDEFEADHTSPQSLATTLSPRLAPLHDLNERYAVVQVGSDVVILQDQENGGIELLKPAAFALMLRNRTVPSATHAGRTEALATAWLGWPERRQYQRLVFRPGELNVPQSEYNLWRGWAVKPDPSGSCELFLRHVREVVCTRDDELYQWLLDWMAHLFHHPQEKLGIVVALQGGQGAGKSIVGRALKMLLGRHQIVADKPDQVFGRFNGHLKHCLVLQAEEAFWGGNRAAAGALKHLATGETLQIEHKGIDSVEMPNFTRLLITTNEDKVWPTSTDDRRLAIFRVSDKYVGNFEYFEAMIHELEKGGAAKLLHTLLNRQIDMARLRRVPVTAALKAQAAESLSIEELWLQRVLSTGEIPGTLDRDGRVRVALAELYDDYRASARERAHLKTEAAFAYFVAERLQADKTPRREWVDTCLRHRVKSTSYIVPSLDEARANYIRRGRATIRDWDGPETWTVADSTGFSAALPADGGNGCAPGEATR